MIVAPAPSALLQIEGLSAGYGALPVLKEVTIAVRARETVAILGPNGHGKTTLMRTISGLLAPSRGRIVFDGSDITAMNAHRLRAVGIGHVPQGDLLFSDMSVLENLSVGAHQGGAWSRRAGRMSELFEIFPELHRRRSALAGTLSGGERRMLAIARALMAPSRLLLVDEPSIGLAPAAIDRVYAVLRVLRDSGVTILLVEENLVRISNFASRVYLLDHGQIVAETTPLDLLNNEKVDKTYLG